MKTAPLTLIRLLAAVLNQGQPSLVRMNFSLTLEMAAEVLASGDLLLRAQALLIEKDLQPTGWIIGEQHPLFDEMWEVAKPTNATTRYWSPDVCDWGD